MTAVSKFYFRYNSQAVPQGTYPSTSATTTAAGVAQARVIGFTRRSMTPFHGWSHSVLNISTSTLANTADQSTCLAEFVSDPIAAQTISAQTITYSGEFVEGNAASNFQPRIYVTLWRPSTGTAVGQLGNVLLAEPGTSATAITGNFTSTSVTAQDGDVIIVEVWRSTVVQSMSTAYTQSGHFSGTTDGSTTDTAAYIQFANAITMLGGTKFYLHFPASTMSGTPPSGTIATTSPTASYPDTPGLAMDTTISTFAQGSITYTTSGTSSQSIFMDRWISDPLDAQTIPVSQIRLVIGLSQTSQLSNVSIGLVAGVWRPSTGALVGRFVDLINNNSAATDDLIQGTTQVNADVSQPTASITTQQGDVVIVEVWRYPSSPTTSPTNNIIYFDGANEYSLTDSASFCEILTPLTFYTAPPSWTYSGTWGMTA
jgi:hypothetical protein